MTATDAHRATSVEAFGGLLDALGRDPDERLSINHLTDSGVFVSVVTTVAEAPQIAAQHGGRDCWYGTAVLHPRVSSGRGEAADVIGVRELYADLDVKPGGLPSYAAAEHVIAELNAMLGVEPVAVVRSGHGLQPHWALDRDARTDWTDQTSPQWLDAVALWRRWHRLVAYVASVHGGRVDNVFDLSRVLRVPGTTNRKEAPVTVTMTLTGGAPVSLERLAETLDEYGVPEVPEDRELLDAVVAEPGEWTWAGTSCRYAAAMLAGWEQDKPNDRHPWLISQATRLAAAHRHGCLTQADHASGVTIITKRFRTRLNVGKRRQEHKGEVEGAFGWGVIRVSTMPVDRLAKELGGHEHVPPPPPFEPQPAASIDTVHEVFRRWLGEGYDLDVLDSVLAAAAAGLALDGDPANLLVVGGSGAAKTETISPLAGAGAIVTSTIASEGALLSGTSAKEKTATATGGLLRKVGDRGVLVLKDVTSILSMSRDARAGVLAALREIADGFWERNLGVDGGLSLPWRGRCTLIGAVTTEWDQAHGVVAKMGDRFPLVRMPDDDALGSGQQALANTGGEGQMRAEMLAVVGGLLQHLEPTSAEPEQYPFILPLANIVTWARTAVVSDYRGDVLDAHAREVPTRFAKQLAQIYRGARCIGLAPEHARRIVVRVAHDSIPPMRRKVLGGLLDQECPSTTLELARRIDRPRTSVDQQLQALQALGLAGFDARANGFDTAWRWWLSNKVDRSALAILTGNVGKPPHHAANGPSATPDDPSEPTRSSTSNSYTRSDDVSRHESEPRNTTANCSCQPAGQDADWHLQSCSDRQRSA